MLRDDDMPREIDRASDDGLGTVIGVVGRYRRTSLDGSVPL